MQPNEINLYFDLYYDEVNKSKRTNKNTNISLVYLSVANLNYKFKSKRNSIGLVAAAKRSVVEQITHRVFFDTIAEEINSLVPIILTKTNNRTGQTADFKFIPIFFSVKADNKGAHEMIIDIPQSFSSGQACRRCYINYSNLAVNKNSGTRSLPSNHVFSICDYFTDNLYSFCWFHDICEGVVERLLHCLLKSEPASYLELLNEKVQTVCKKIYKRNKLSSFTITKKDQEIKLKGTGVQKLLFFNLYSLVNDKYGRNTNQWKCYFLLRKIINVCSTDEIYREDLPRFKALCSKFIDMYIITFDATVVFKIHYLEHYDECIEEFALMMLSSTLAYERVNQKTVRSTEGSRNYADVAVQMFNNFSFKVDDYFKIKVQNDFRSYKDVDEQYQEYLKDDENNSNILDCKMIVIENMKIKLNSFYLLEYDNEKTRKPIFLIVHKIYYIENEKKTVIIGLPYVAIDYDIQTLTYKVQKSRQLIKVNPSRFLHHKKATVFTNISQQNMMILDNYYVKNDFEYLNELNIQSPRR